MAILHRFGRGRRPPRGTPEFFRWSYARTPPWEIGAPQPELVRLAEAGAIGATVLDVGCGTGENALYLSGRGHDVMGIDASEVAIKRAAAKARRRGAGAEFRVGDALDLEAMGRTFDTVVDCGLYYVFDDESRPRFVDGLAAVLRPGGQYHVLCISEHDVGKEPRRVTQEELRTAFSSWSVESIREATYLTVFRPATAWLATITRPNR